MGSTRAFQKGKLTTNNMWSTLGLKEAPMLSSGHLHFDRKVSILIHFHQEPSKRRNIFG